jgi:hypothetical protein
MTSFQLIPRLQLQLKTKQLLLMNNENEFLPIWRSIKTILPPVVTGAFQDGVGDRNPGEALYNLVFVRMPTLLCGLWYANSLYNGGGQFSLDFGFGPLEVGPTAVALVLYLILLREPQR